MLNDNAWQNTLVAYCRSAASQILKSVPFDEFRLSLEKSLPMLLDALGVPMAVQAPEMLRNMATQVALEIWNATPIPENRFRPRKQAKPERNAPCLCGSGRKFKQCCAAVDVPLLGITEELMLAQVLALMPAKKLAEVPLLELHPESLAQVAHSWLEEGQPNKAIKLLERLFVHIDQLDGRAEMAADTLLDAYLEIDAPRKKQKFINTLIAAPDKALRSAGWQRQTTMHSDRGDFPAAWESFREAQRLTPNEPALSHLEILVLISEGRRGEARARAKFWAAKLSRDPEYDHSDLIKLLHDLTDGSDESLLRTLPLGRGPLAALGEAITRWPDPACHYVLRGGELTAQKELRKLESDYAVLFEEGKLESVLFFLGEEPLVGQSFQILLSILNLIDALPENLPGSGDALARQVLERAEALRRIVLSRAKALKAELPWGLLGNRPLLTLASYYVEEFLPTRSSEMLELMRWSVTIANPTDNTGLRQLLIHALVAAGLAKEAMAVAACYPDDFAATEYGRVLAFHAAGQLAEAEAALKAAAVRWPKVWKMLHAANPKAPRSNPHGITVGGDDEAYNYRHHHLELWRSTGALKWGAGIRLAAKPKAPPAADDNQPLLF